MTKGEKLNNKLEELKEQYQQGLLTLDELVNFCARAGIDATEEVIKELYIRKE